MILPVSRESLAELSDILALRAFEHGDFKAEESYRRSAEILRWVAAHEKRRGVFGIYGRN